MTDCAQHREEIAAAAGDPLPAPVEEHVESCDSCRALRERTLALASMSAASALTYTRTDAQAVARRAKTEATRSTFVWAAPLISASATTAGLILFFGLAGVASSPTTPSPPDPVDVLDQAYEQSGTFELPDPLRAVQEIMADKENDQ